MTALQKTSKRENNNFIIHFKCIIAKKKCKYYVIKKPSVCVCGTPRVTKNHVKLRKKIHIHVWLYIKGSTNNIYICIHYYNNVLFDNLYDDTLRLTLTRSRPERMMIFRLQKHKLPFTRINPCEL